MLELANFTVWVCWPYDPLAKVWDQASAIQMFEVGGRITDVYGWEIDYDAGRKMTANFGSWPRRRNFTLS